MSKIISSLGQLIDTLNHSSRSEYKSIGASLSIPKEDFTPYMHWSDSRYTRNCITRNNDFELILLCWKIDQFTDFHCHGGEECWVYLIDGALEESHYNMIDDKLTFGNKSQLETGFKSFMSDELGFHKLGNNTNKRSMSLHLYMDPIDNCTVFDKKSNAFIPRSLAYHSFKGSLEEVTI